jgi:succinate dehydrogenase/fumarate reductase cytochrome b subunit
MALFHWTFGLYTILWPITNLQKAPPVYDPRIAAFIIISYVMLVTFLWGSKTLAQFRFARSDESHAADKHQPVTAGQ